MNDLKYSTSRECGSALVVVMLFLAIVTIIGISATNISTTELKIADNDKNYKTAFYHSEGGVYTIAKWIGQVVDENDVHASGDDNEFTYLDRTEGGEDDLDELLGKVMGYNSTYDADMDIEFTMAAPSCESTVQTDIRRTKPKATPGSSNQFATGASSHGIKTSVDRPYWITSTAKMDNNTTVTLTGRYLKVDGTGGL